jgi:CheY-like chemotaxis protein
MKKKTILLVDDEIDILVLLREVLHTELDDIVEASNGEDAYAILKKQSFDYIILDLEMPKMSGVEILHNVKKLHHLQNSQFIISTGYKRNYLREIPEDMTIAHLLKPYSYVDLVSWFRKNYGENWNLI